MKLRLLTIAAVSAVAFAACTGGNNDGSYTQEQLDSIIKAKEDSTAAALKFQADSLLKAQADATADSLRIADSLAAATKTVTKTTKTVTKRPSSGGTSTTVTEKEETVVEPKPIDKGSTTNRPGAKSSTTKENGTTTKEAPKSTTDRPGAK